MKRVFSYLGACALIVCFSYSNTSAQATKGDGPSKKAAIENKAVSKTATENIQPAAKAPEMSPLNPTGKVSQIVPRDRASRMRMIEARAQKTKTTTPSASPEVAPATVPAPVMRSENLTIDN